MSEGKVISLMNRSIPIIAIQLNDRGSAIEQYKILKKLDTEKANKLFNEIYSE